MSRVKRAVLLLMILVLFGCGGGAATRAGQTFSARHVVSIAPDINMIMATGACAPSSGG